MGNRGQAWWARSSSDTRRPLMVIPSMFEPVMATGEKFTSSNLAPASDTLVIGGGPEVHVVKAGGAQIDVREEGGPERDLFELGRVLRHGGSPVKLPSAARAR